MSLKAIDGQLSLSRTMEAQSVQNQMQHKPADDQRAGANGLQKQLEAERNKSNQLDKPAEAQIRDGGGQGDKNQGHPNKGKDDHSNEEVSRSDHPYKGKFIDYSL